MEQYAGQTLRCRVNSHSHYPSGAKQLQKDKFYRLNRTGEIYHIYDESGYSLIELHFTNIPFYFYTVAEERDLKLTNLGI